MLVSLRQNEVELDKMTDESSELVQMSGEAKISVSVQQITSRFQSVQTTAKVGLCNRTQITNINKNHNCVIKMLPNCTMYVYKHNMIN